MWYVPPFGKRPFKGPVTLLLINVNNFCGFFDMILQVGRNLFKVANRGH